MTNSDHSTGEPLRLQVDTFRNTATALEDAATLLRTSVHESLKDVQHTGVDRADASDYAAAEAVRSRAVAVIGQVLEETTALAIREEKSDDEEFEQ